MDFSISVNLSQATMTGATVVAFCYGLGVFIYKMSKLLG